MNDYSAIDDYDYVTISKSEYDKLQNAPSKIMEAFNIVKNWITINSPTKVCYYKDCSKTCNSDVSCKECVRIAINEIESFIGKADTIPQASAPTSRMYDHDWNKIESEGK